MSVGTAKFFPPVISSFQFGFCPSQCSFDGPAVRIKFHNPLKTGHSFARIVSATGHAEPGLYIIRFQGCSNGEEEVSFFSIFFLKGSSP